jgi:thiamine transport system ATP-binding protein
MLSIRGAARAFDGIPALKGVSLDVGQGEILCLLGPSGCGKTTLLRIIAGLEQVDEGDVLLNDRSIRNVPVHQRGFGLMFQDFALFPHMNVSQNILFGLRMRDIPVEAQQRRLQEVLKLVGLVGFEKRDVTQLSGGERQRVALARSLAPSPRLLMLDEPLGSLDAALRERLIVDLHGIIRQTGLTALYVTHDQKEAFAIADRIAVMNAGKIEQVDTPQTIYRQPQTVFVARFLGLNNIIPVLSHNGDLAHTAFGDFAVHKVSPYVLLHPDNLTLVASDDPKAFLGRVSEVMFLGDSYRLNMAHDSGIHLSFKISSQSNAVPVIGDMVTVRVNDRGVIPLEATK